MGIAIHPEIAAQFDENVKAVIASGQLSLGAMTALFEDLWSQYTGCHAVATSNGTTAIELIGINLFQKGRRSVAIPVLSPPMVKWAWEKAGFSVGYFDVDPIYGVPTLQNIKDVLEASKPDVVCIVHNGGVITPDILSIRIVLEALDIPLVEDCSHAHMCSFAGTRAGCFGEYAAWSFYPTKVMIASEGGIAGFHHAIDCTTMMAYSNQGKERGSGIFGECGYNLRPSELSMALAVAEMKNKGIIFSDRLAWLRGYAKDLPVIQGAIVGLSSSCYKYTVVAPSYDEQCEAKRKIQEAGLACAGSTYDFIMAHNDAEFPGAATFRDTHVNLPFVRFVDNDVGMDMIERTLCALKNFHFKEVPPTESLYVSKGLCEEPLLENWKIGN